jgi:hypothetical protein
MVLLWARLLNSMLTLELTSHSIAIAFADDLLILARGETVVHEFGNEENSGVGTKQQTEV